jgi:hypothetical protein
VIDIPLTPVENVFGVPAVVVPGVEAGVVTGFGAGVPVGPVSSKIVSIRLGIPSTSSFYF